MHRVRADDHSNNMHSTTLQQNSKQQKTFHRIHSIRYSECKLYILFAYIQSFTASFVAHQLLDSPPMSATWHLLLLCDFRNNIDSRHRDKSPILFQQVTWH